MRTPLIASDALITSFSAGNFDTNLSVNGGLLFIPPDSHAAAGPSHVANVVNCFIQWWNKDGTSPSTSSLAAFSSGFSPLTATFDPKIIYDQYADRFVVLTLEHTDTSSGGAANTSGIEVNDRRALNAVWRPNSIWVSFTMKSKASGPDPNQTTAAWVKLDTSTGTPTLADQGRIYGETIASTTHTFFPSIGVNRYGEAAMGLSASASSIFAGSYYTWRTAGDAAGSTRTPSVLRAGTDFYVRTFGQSQNRWDDYSGTGGFPGAVGGPTASSISGARPSGERPVCHQREALGNTERLEIPPQYWRGIPPARSPAR